MTARAVSPDCSGPGYAAWVLAPRLDLFCLSDGQWFLAVSANGAQVFPSLLPGEALRLLGEHAPETSTAAGGNGAGPPLPRSDLTPQRRDDR